MKFLFLINILILSLQASSYDVVIKSPFNDTLYSVVEDYDGGISTVGFYKNMQTGHSSAGQSFTNPFSYLEHVDAQNGINMQLIKLDKHGKISFKKTLHVGKFSKAIALSKTPDNGYFIGGYTLDGHLVIAKVDSRGNELFVKVFGEKHFDRMSKMITMPDGSVVIVGSSMSQTSSNESIYNDGLGKSDIMVVHISTNGTILWSKKFGTRYDDKGIDIVNGGDGTVVVLGETVEHGKNKIVLMRISSFGTLLWYKTYLNKKDITPYCMAKLHNHNYLVSYDAPNEDNRKQINFIKFDSQGDIIQHVEIPTQYPAALLDITEDKNGYIIGVGKIIDESYQDTDALLMKFHSSLKLVYKRHFGSAYYDLFRSVVVLRDGDYVAVGDKTKIQSEVSNMWIMKLTPRGTIVSK